jgi:hypothetical protein
VNGVDDIERLIFVKNRIWTRLKPVVVF